MFEAATGERRAGEEAAAASAALERSEKLSDCSEVFVQNCGSTAEIVWVLNPLTGKSVGVKTHIPHGCDVPGWNEISGDRLVVLVVTKLACRDTLYQGSRLRRVDMQRVKTALVWSANKVSFASYSD